MTDHIQIQADIFRTSVILKNVPQRLQLINHAFSLRRIDDFLGTSAYFYTAPQFKELKQPAFINGGKRERLDMLSVADVVLFI